MYGRLKEQEASEITVREFAKENNCSPAALYRHFESLEYLIILGSVKFFMDYMTEYGRLMDSGGKLLESYVKGWQLFNRYAFERPDLYYRLLWGHYNKDLSDALAEYFELFPTKGSEQYPAYFYTLLFTSDIRERDFLVLRRAVNYGMLSYEDAVYFSSSNTLLVKGMLEMYMGCSREERKQGEETCNRLLLRNLGNVIYR